MAFCPDDDGWNDLNGHDDDGQFWDDGDDNFNDGEDAWNTQEDFTAQDTDQFVVGTTEWRGDPSRRHRRLNNPAACEDLRMAILAGSVEGVDDVLNTYDDLHVDDTLRNGLTALITAADAAQPDVLRFLLSYGASPDAGQSVFEGIYPPLTAACNSSCPDEHRVEKCVERLVSHGVDVDLVDGRSLTPLMYACKHGRRSVVQLLIQKGADVNLQTNEGWTALCYAAHAGQLGTVQLLLSCQAQPDLACYDGQLAEDLAFSNEHAEVADYLSAVLAGENPSVPVAYQHPHSQSLEENTLDNEASYYQYGDLESFLQHLSLSQFAKVLLERDITLQQLLTMSEGELEQAGVHLVGARMKIIEESTKTMLAMWAKPPPEDDLKRREILQSNLHGMDAKLIAGNLERHVSYAVAAIEFLDCQLPGVLTATRTDDEVEECIGLIDEVYEATSKVQDTTQDIVDTLNTLTAPKLSSKLPLWLAGGAGTMLVGGVAIYLLRERLR